MKKDEIEENNNNSKEIEVKNKNNNNKPIGNIIQQSKRNTINNETIINLTKSKNNQTKLWNQIKYDIGSWTKSKMIKYQQHKVNLQHSKIIKTNNSLRKETSINKIKGVPNPWKIIVDKVPNQLIHPNKIIISTTSSLSSLTKNSIPNLKKKMTNRMDTFITSWGNKLKETKLKQSISDH